MMDTRTPPPNELTDEDILRAIQAKARDDRHYAIAWALLRLADAIREAGKPRGK